MPKDEISQIIRSAQFVASQKYKSIEHIKSFYKKNGALHSEPEALILLASLYAMSYTDELISAILDELSKR